MATYRLTSRRTAFGLFLTIAIAALGGCSKGPEPVKGFILPEGDIERGKEVFASTGCRYCHNIKDEEFGPLDGEQVLNITLGGEVHRVKNYGELLTSIVYPQHVVSARYRATLDSEERRDAESPMPEFNDVITVTQLIDLTTYLHSRYEELSPQYRGYYYVP